MNTKLNTEKSIENVIQFADIENTPFQIAHDKENNCFYVLLGNNAIHPKEEPFKSEEEAIAYAMTPNWDNLLSVFYVLLQNQEKFKK